MAKVVGVGGVFLRARDPGALAHWYAEALGIAFEGDDHFVALVNESPNSTAVFSFCGSDDHYMGDPSRLMAMVNFRVDDLDGVLNRRRATGADVEAVREEPYGQFSWSTDPEGNRCELWEPDPTP